MSTDALAARLAITRTWSEAATSGEAVAAALAAARAVPTDLLTTLRDADQVVYAGAGSSYYVAQAVAWAHREILGRPAVATALSELLLRPGGVLTRGARSGRPIVVISRSGTTSEAVEVASRSTAAGHPVVAVTCRPAAPLATVATHRLVSPEGDETAVVMTRSFTSMLALLMRVVAALGGRVAPAMALAADLDALPARWGEASAAAALAPAVAGARDWSRVVILGGGAAYGLASEAGLKLTETSRVPADWYAPLEFRHGPLSLGEPGVLVVALPDGDPQGGAAELAVVRETVALGASGWVLGTSVGGLEGLPRPDDAAGLAAAVGVAGGLAATVVGDGLHPLARLPLLMPPIQALALSVAVARGCDPDEPRHIGQVVVLEP